MVAYSYSYRSKKTGGTVSGSVKAKRVYRKKTVYRKRKINRLKTLFPRSMTGKFKFFKSLNNITVSASSSIRRVLYGTDISPYSTVDNANALGAWTYEQAPINPDTYYNGIAQYCDIYNKAHVLFSKLELHILASTNATTGYSYGLSVICLPVVGGTDGLDTITSKITALDALTYDELASLKNAKFGMIGYATGGPNQYRCKSMISAKSMYGVKDVIDRSDLQCELPVSGSLLGGKRIGFATGAGGVDENATAYYIRVFNTSASQAQNINIQISMTGYIRLHDICNTGQQIISA